MDGEFNSPRNTMYDNNYNNQQYEQINYKYSGEGMCFLLFLIVCSIFLSYCFDCSNTTGRGIYTSDIERPILIVNTIPYNETINQKTCSICLEEYKQNDQVFVSKCKHIFHKDCISSWLNINNRTCPLCRHILS